MLGTYGAYQAIYVMPGLFIGWMKCIVLYGIF